MNSQAVLNLMPNVAHMATFDPAHLARMDDALPPAPGLLRVVFIGDGVYHDMIKPTPEGLGVVDVWDNWFDPESDPDKIAAGHLGTVFGLTVLRHPTMTRYCGVHHAKATTLLLTVLGQLTTPDSVKLGETEAWLDDLRAKGQ